MPCADGITGIAKAGIGKSFSLNPADAVFHCKGMLKMPGAAAGRRGSIAVAKYSSVNLGPWMSYQCELLLSPTDTQGNLSPLARKVAAHIKTLLRAVDKFAHQDEALHGLTSSRADNLSPRTQDSSLKEKKSMIKKHNSWQLSHYNPLLINEKEVENWVLCEQFVTEVQEEAPTSRPPPADTVSLGSGDTGPVGCAQDGMLPISASGETPLVLFDLGSKPGKKLLDCEGSSSPRVLVVDQMQVVQKSVVTHHEWHQVSEAEFSSGVGILGIGVAPVQTPSGCSWLRPILDPKNCRQQLLLDAQSCSQAGNMVRIDFPSGLYSNLDGLVTGLQAFESSNCSQLLNAHYIVEGVHNLDRMETEGTWIQAKSRRKRKAAPKNSKSSSGIKAKL
ncbi:hypothetical protein Nepgr_012469 [Nepenthes gracilis]|uniref:Uncharacterized protein n=1 Tax=Nepenthes gracilis TaxID=150966 RepID=A0AAD3SG13_NEPGR|nr:hypothetical protein Nepgr_012469 [Nepenthes gracilis]